MDAHPTIRAVVARLVTDPAGAEGRLRAAVYRPLVIGPAMLRRRPGEGRWSVAVSDDGQLEPRLPPSSDGLQGHVRQLQEAGFSCRLAAALLAPQDLGHWQPRPRPSAAPRRLARPEFYGWALMYQLPGQAGEAFVDPHDRFADLPAFYELPAEFVDRSAFLAARGVRSRPIAVVTQPDDFLAGDDGRPQNRFYPGGVFRDPGGLDWLD